ncbi:MAG: S41 family peptidase [Chloroflexota bacterium]
MSHRNKTILMLVTLGLSALACQTVTGVFSPSPQNNFPIPDSTAVPTYAPDVTPPAPTPTSTLVPLNGQEQQAIFDELWDVVNEEYLYEDFNGVDWDAAYIEFSQKITDGMSSEDFYFGADELIFNLGDEHSIYLNPQVVAWEDAEYDRGSDYVGIGIWIEMVPDRERAVVLLTFPGGPADQAGIQAHDSIVSVEGVTYADADMFYLDRLDGVAGTPVTLTVQSPGEEPRQLTVVRDRITGSLPIPHFVATTPAGQKIGYLLVPTFSDGSIGDLVGEALDELGAEGELDGLIIDQRMNSGGYDTVMADTLGYFASGLVGHFSNRSKDTPLRITRRNVSGSASLPLVVLVGEGTASFAEIFSGILQDLGRATVIGETTLGNVEILWGYDFEDGSRAWIAHDTFIPLNQPEANWEKLGIIPSFEVSAPWDLYTFDTDPAILKALEYFDL